MALSQTNPDIIALNIATNSLRDYIQLQYAYNLSTGVGAPDPDYDSVLMKVSPNTDYVITEAAIGVIFYKYSPVPVNYLYYVSGTITSFITPPDCDYIAIVFEDRSSKDDYENTYVLPEQNLVLKNTNELKGIPESVGDVQANRGVAPYIELLTSYNVSDGSKNPSAFYDSYVLKVSENTNYISTDEIVICVFYSDLPSTNTYISGLVLNGTAFTTPSGCEYCAILFTKRVSASDYNFVYITVQNSLSEQVLHTKSNVSDLTGFYNAISRSNKPLTRLAFEGDSLTANLIGGSIPSNLDEGNTMQPMRLLSNNFPRRMYDALSWNKPIWRRLDNINWANSGFTSFTEADLFDGTQEVYYTSSVINSYIEITVPQGYENFALICRQKDSYGSLNVTINGSAPGTYPNPYWDAKVLTNTVVNSSVVPQFLDIGPAVIDLDKPGSSIQGNPYYIVEFNNLPTGQPNVIRFTVASNVRCDVWGGFYWSGQTLVCMNIAHGGHTTTDLLNDHLQDELFDANYDMIIFEIPEMNNQRLTLLQTESDLNTIINILKGKNVVYTSCYPWGLSITYDVNMWTFYTNPNLLEVNNLVRNVITSQDEAFIDIFDYFQQLIEARGGSLPTGETGLWYTHDGQHGNIDGCREWFNALYRKWVDLHFSFSNRSHALPEVQRVASASTTNATPSTILSVEIPDGSSVRIDASLKAKSGNDYLSGRKYAVIKNVGGTLSIVGAITDIVPIASQGVLTTSSFTFTSSGTSALIQVTGASATNVDWDAIVKYRIN